MSSTNPDQIERDIATTRESLRNDVNRFSDKASPSKVATRRIDKIKGSASAMKDRVMGSSSGGDGSSALSSAKDAADSAASKMSGVAGNAPTALRDKAQGNPLAAGIIAFGAGWLLSSLIPASEAEQHAAKRIEDNAGGVVDQAKQSAQEVAGNLQQPLQESVEQVKSTAGDAADRTTEHAKSAASDVKDAAQGQQSDDRTFG